MGKTWDAQVTRALQTSLDENLRMIADSVAHLKGQGRYVVFDAEHFFDGYKANPAYALACVRAAADAGADSVDLCETNGGALPFEVEAVVAAVAAELPNTQLGIHCHNDSGCAVANTLAAVRAGVRQVQGTVNGIGERVGNTDLLTVVADLELKMGAQCVGSEALREMTSVSQFVAECCNVSVSAHHPYTGSSAFAHKGGLHASAIARFPEAYEHERPESVGNTARMLVSELAGKASLAAKAASLGVDLAAHPGKDQEILDDIKAREASGYSYETADGSLALLIQRHLGLVSASFHAWRASASSWTTTRTPARWPRMPSPRPRSRSTWAPIALRCHGRGSGPGGCPGQRSAACHHPVLPDRGRYGAGGLQGAHSRREHRYRRHHPRNHHHLRRARVPGARSAFPKTSSRLLGTRWSIR